MAWSGDPAAQALRHISLAREVLKDRELSPADTSILFKLGIDMLKDAVLDGLSRHLSREEVK